MSAKLCPSVFIAAYALVPRAVKTPEIFRNARKAPSIFGTFPNNAGVFTSFDMESFEEPTDAFKSDWNVEVRLQRNDESGAKFRESRLVFKASNSSPIYSDSVSTVQPSSLRALVLVRAY